MIAREALDAFGRWSARPTARALACAALLATIAVAPLRAQDSPPAAENKPARELADLPLVELPPQGANTATMAIFLSGDGGWADLDKHVSEELSRRGVGVVGVSSRAYLARRKSPDQAATDVARIARAYMARWGANRLVLIGYSRGAGMLPFVATRLAPDVRDRVALLAMFGMERWANFQFHWIDVVRDVHRKDDLPVAPELARLHGQRMLCVYGTEEHDSACRDADSTLITKVERRGGHHFDSDYRSLGDLVIGMLDPAAR